MRIFLIVLAAFSCLAIALLMYFLGYRHGVYVDDYTVFDEGVAASWGTIFSAILTLVSIVLIFITYRSQKSDLAQTQYQVKLQNADSGFFNMLSMLGNLTDSMEKELFEKYSNSSATMQIYKGRTYIKKAFDIIKNQFSSEQFRYHYNPATDRYDIYKIDLVNMNVDMVKALVNPSSEPLNPQVTYKETFLNESISVQEYQYKLYPTCAMFFEGSNGDLLKHYFSFLESIVDFVISQYERDQDRDARLKILATLLSNEELGMLYYYSLSRMNNHFLMKIAKYRLLRKFDHIKLKERSHFFIYISMRDQLKKRE